MKRISFYNTNRSDDLLHIETELCIVNIRVNLSNDNGQAVTNIEILPDCDCTIDGSINNKIIGK